MSGLTEQDLARIIAAIDSTDIGTQCSVIPEGAPGRFHLTVAVRAARRVREATVDAIALAAEGRTAEALQISNEAARHLETMQRKLFNAVQDAGQ